MCFLMLNVQGAVTVLWQASVVSLFGLVAFRLWQTQQQAAIDMSEYELVEQGRSGAGEISSSNESRSKAK